jgi:hypothetical protein
VSRRCSLLRALVLLLAPACLAQEQSVVKLTHTKVHAVVVERSSGNAWCLDQDCSTLVTAKHVIEEVRPREIEGIRILAIRSSDKLDLSVITLVRGLSGHRGVASIQPSPSIGGHASLVFYSVMSSHISVVDVRLVAVETGGALLFSAPSDLYRGCSGGLIVNAAGEALGVLITINGNMFEAVSAAQIRDFLDGRPTTAAPTAITDTPVAPEIMPHLRSRDMKPEALLRVKLRRMHDQMTNFIALQRLRLMPEGYVVQHEVRVVEGEPSYRDLNTSRSYYRIPVLPNSTLPGTQWYDLLEVVSSKAYLQKRDEKTFLWSATAEDNACGVWIGGWIHREELIRPCWGEITLDDEGQVATITQRISPGKQISFLQIEVRYGDVILPIVGVRRVPHSIRLIATLTSGKEQRCEGSYTDYKVFAAESFVHFPSEQN